MTGRQLVAHLQSLGAGYYPGDTWTHAPLIAAHAVYEEWIAIDPIKWRDIGRPRGRDRYIGVATQRGYTVISYGPK